MGDRLGPTQNDPYRGVGDMWRWSFRKVLLYFVSQILFLRFCLSDFVSQILFLRYFFPRHYFLAFDSQTLLAEFVGA